MKLKERYNWIAGPGIVPMALAVWGVIFLAGFFIVEAVKWLS